ncbi:hypothetical protein [Mesorhizobium sp. M1405]|uniref:hypothetical protein n=1 Tax=unclassified Mesorhizobium TaxID=325217 RepID=UPI00333B1537
MPSVTARRKCPDLIFRQAPVRRLQDGLAANPEIFAEHTPLIEPAFAGRGLSRRDRKHAGMATVT